MLAHDRPLVHGRGALGSPHGHTPSFAANTGPREVTSSAAPREHAPAGGREGEVYRPSYAARALVWVRWTRGAPWFGRCSRGAAQLEARRGERLHYAQPRVLVGPPSRRGRGCILLVIPRVCLCLQFCVVDICTCCLLIVCMHLTHTASTFVTNPGTSHHHAPQMKSRLSTRRADPNALGERASASVQVTLRSHSTARTRASQRASRRPSAAVRRGRVSG